MLELIDKDWNVIQQVNEGSRFRLPNGDHVSPAQVGWWNKAGYRLQRQNPPAPPPPMASDVKHEARRRILAIADKDRQDNMLAYAIETMRDHGTDPANWPDDRKVMNAAFSAKWDAIKAIRSRSNEIEAMEAIPADFVDDKYWF